MFIDRIFNHDRAIQTARNRTIHWLFLENQLDEDRFSCEQDEKDHLKIRIGCQDNLLVRECDFRLLSIRRLYIEYDHMSLAVAQPLETLIVLQQGIHGSNTLSTHVLPRMNKTNGMQKADMVVFDHLPVLLQRYSDNLSRSGLRQYNDAVRTSLLIWVLWILLYGVNIGYSQWFGEISDACVIS